MGIKSNRTRWHITWRTLVAIFLGYLFANSVSMLLMFILPLDRLHGVVLGTLLTFVFWTAAVMWVFSVDRMRAAAVPMLICTVIFSAAAWRLYLLDPAL
ncbi:MAG: DUF3649 domain-containing protein [Pseudomonadota bacterium]